MIFHNPLVYESIQVKEAISLDANEVLVVYGLHSTDQTVTRYLRNGPSVFVPKANEWSVVASCFAESVQERWHLKRFK